MRDSGVNIIGACALATGFAAAVLPHLVLHRGGWLPWALLAFAIALLLAARRTDALTSDDPAMRSVFTLRVAVAGIGFGIVAASLFRAGAPFFWPTRPFLPTSFFFFGVFLAAAGARAAVACQRRRQVGPDA